MCHGCAVSVSRGWWHICVLAWHLAESQDDFGRAAWRRATFFPGLPSLSALNFPQKERGGGGGVVGTGTLPWVPPVLIPASARGRGSCKGIWARWSILEVAGGQSKKAAGLRASQEGKRSAVMQKAGRMARALTLLPLNIAESTWGENFSLALPQSERCLCSVTPVPKQPPRVRLWGVSRCLPGKRSALRGITEKLRVFI